MAWMEPLDGVTHKFTGKICKNCQNLAKCALIRTANAVHPIVGCNFASNKRIHSERHLFRYTPIWESIMNESIENRPAGINDSTQSIQRRAADQARPDRRHELEKYRKFLDGQLSGITRRFGGKLESSDLVQKTLAEAFERLDQFRGTTEGELAKWLSQILSNNTVDAARMYQRQKRDINRECSLDQSERSSIGQVGDWLSADQTTPSFAVQNAEQILQLSQAIHQLPNAQQQVIVLHHLQGLTLNEVAERIERSRAAVAGLAYRALKNLRQYMLDHD